MGEPQVEVKHLNGKDVELTVIYPAQGWESFRTCTALFFRKCQRQESHLLGSLNKKMFVSINNCSFSQARGAWLCETVCGELAIQTLSACRRAGSKYGLHSSVELLLCIPTGKPECASGPPVLLGHTSASAGPCLNQGR